MAPRVPLCPAVRPASAPGRRPSALAPFAAAALLAGATGCYKYQPLNAAAPPPAKEVEGSVVRFKEGPFEREMRVTTMRYPWVGGDTADEKGALHPITMDLRMMHDAKLRTGSSAAKVTLIVVGSTVVAGALAAAAVAALTRNNLHF